MRITTASSLLTLALAATATAAQITSSVVSAGGTITTNGSLIVLGQPIIGLSSSTKPAVTANAGFVPTAATPPPCPADTNADGSVNGADLSVLLSQFSQNVTPGTGADFNSDGLVNGADLSVLLSNFGLNC